MTFLLLVALLRGAQGIPTLPDQSGTITGVLKDSAGKPATGIRIGAIPVPDPGADTSNGSAMVSLAQTDGDGRYQLENIPPGRYYVGAGRVDFPTYYPGTLAMARGTIIPITPKAVVNGIDFAMQDSSVRVDSTNPVLNSLLTFSLPMQVKVEGGGKLPVFSPNGFMVVRLANTAAGTRTDIPINASTIAVPSPTAEYRVSVENMPAGYGVKSITAGTTDIKAGTLRLAALTFGSTAPGTAGPMTATTTLLITLTSPAPVRPSPGGVRVTGRANDGKRRSIYLSGKPGTFYSDGTFEFRGVPPGRHIVATIENPESMRPVGTSVVVGSRDVEGIELEEVRVLPQDIQSPQTMDAGSNPPGSAVRLASLRIAILDEGNREPVGPGSVYILGPMGTSFDLPSDGRFEFPKLLPGKYSFEILVFRHASITRTVVIGDEDVNLELPAAAVD